MPLRRSACALAAAGCVLCTAFAGDWASAQGMAVPRAPATGVAPKPGSESGASWRDLTPAQRTALAPLERDWSSINAPHKQKWLELSTRFPSMTPDERSRVQTRMTDWAKLSSDERSRARLNFEQAKQVPSKDRQARWEAYQALPPEQKRELADRAAPPPSARNAETARKAAGAHAERNERPGAEVPQTKSNIVPNPALAAAPRPIAPSMVQAQPGATTTWISKRPSPPAHQQSGLPKITATPEFVNKATLLPKRGPQAASVRPTPDALQPPAAPAAGASRQ